MKQTTEAVVEIADRAMEAAEDAMQKCRAAAGKLLGQTICAIMEQEIMLQLRERRMADAHYANARNGYKRKTLTSNFGSIQTRVPQDRSSDYEPILIGKYRKDVRDIEGAIFRLYAGGKAARLTAAKALYGVLAKRELSEAIVNAIEPTACEIWSRPVEPELALLCVDTAAYEANNADGEVSVFTGVSEGGPRAGSGDLLHRGRKRLARRARNIKGTRPARRQANRSPRNRSDNRAVWRDLPE